MSPRRPPSSKDRSDQLSSNFILNGGGLLLHAGPPVDHERAVYISKRGLALDYHLPSSDAGRGGPNYFEVEMRQWDRDKTRIIIGYVARPINGAGGGGGGGGLTSSDRRANTLRELHHATLNGPPMLAFEVPSGLFSKVYSYKGPAAPPKTAEKKFARPFATGDTIGVGFRPKQVSTYQAWSFF